jgi:hypothetical protein
VERAAARRPGAGRSRPRRAPSLRARFLAPGSGLSEEDALARLKSRDERLDVALSKAEPIVLWFEADLYDVLLLLQVLDRLPGHTPARLVLVGQQKWTSVTEVDPFELATLGAEAPLVTPAQMDLARRSWAAFTAATPWELERLARGTPALPAIAQAVHRLLEELPWTGNGLSRTERQLLEALANGARTREEAFVAAVRAEERPFLGDASAWTALDRLAPLFDADAPNARGRAVLAGSEEWQPPEERWIGGVRLPPGRSPWHWDPAARRVVPSSPSRPD